MSKITLKDIVWYKLSENYGELCWKMIDDIKPERMSHKKCNDYMDLIMANIEDDPAIQMFVTFARVLPLDPSKLACFETWHRKYGPFIVNNQNKSYLKGYEKG